MSQALVKILGREMTSEMRFQFERLVDSMTKDLIYIEGNRKSLLEAAVNNGWTTERIRVVIVLNSFHRLLIAPLSAAFELELDCGLGSKIPVHYGQALVVDTATGAGIRRALSAYRAIIERAEIEEFWLSLPGVSDLVYMLGRLEAANAEDT